jgi:Ca-activated chloride channel family protein
MRRPLIRFALLLVTVISLTGCGTRVPAETAPAPSLKDDCTPIVVGTSSEKVNLVEELGNLFKESAEGKNLTKCATVYAINVPSGKGANIIAEQPTQWPLADKNFWPTIWSPASTMWTDRVTASGAGSFINKAESFAKTPVVFAMPESMATALDYPAKPISIKQIEGLIANKEGWGSVGKPLWGAFKIAKTNPNTSTTGLSVILMQSYAHSNKTEALTVEDVTGSAAFNTTFEGGAIHYGDTTGKVLRTLAEKLKQGNDGNSYVSAVAVEETSLYNYNLGNPDSHTVQPGETLTPPTEKLVAIYPEEGSMWSDNPATLLNAAWVTQDQKLAGTAFLNFLKTPQAQNLLPKYGFRPVLDSVGYSKTLNSAMGIIPTQPTKSLPKPSANVVSAALDQWSAVRKPSAVLELIDISGSMNENAGNGKSKLVNAITSAQNTLSNFRTSDKVGVWAFTTGIQSAIGQNIVPVRDFTELGGDREKLVTSLEDLKNSRMNGTPLYDSISVAYDYLLPQAEVGRINAIVVLSDGSDVDSNTTLTSLLVKLNTANKEGAHAPVRIFTIAYGTGANKQVLDQISQASGGQMFDATDATRINEVFSQVMNNF